MIKIKCAQKNEFYYLYAKPATPISNVNFAVNMIRQLFCVVFP